MNNRMSTPEESPEEYGCSDHSDCVTIEDYRTGDSICRECGMVLGRTVDMDAEWRTYSVTSGREKADQSRVGGPMNPLLNGTDLGTAIAETSKAGSGYGKYSKIIKGGDRHLIHGFTLIDRMGEAVHATKNACMMAQNIFKEALEKKALFKNKSMEAMAAASLYVACRMEGIFVLYKPLCREARIKKLEIGKCFKLIIKALNITLAMVTSADYIGPLCSHLDLPHTIGDAAHFVAKAAVEMDIVAGRSPLAVAAAAVYMVSQASNPEMKRTRQEVAKVADVADITVSITYKQMYPSVESIFPSDFLFFTPIEELPLS